MLWDLFFFLFSLFLLHFAFSLFRLKNVVCFLLSSFLMKFKLKFLFCRFPPRDWNRCSCIYFCFCFLFAFVFFVCFWFPVCLFLKCFFFCWLVLIYMAIVYSASRCLFLQPLPSKYKYILSDMPEPNDSELGFNTICSSVEVAVV